MKINAPAVRQCLKSFDFKTLFREHLGWDQHNAQLDIPIDDSKFSLTAVAQKRGFVAYLCPSIPDRATRLKIDHRVTKTSREHIIVYTDKPNGQQVWQWVRREPGKPMASRDRRFDASQLGDHLIQRLEQIAVSLDEEETLTVVDVAGRARAAFDVEKVTKQFYDRFKAEHAAFLKFMKGLPPSVTVVRDGKRVQEPHPDHQWYTSLMLNRLMFVYFIQKKGFLDGDLDYLRNRMKLVRQQQGKDKFVTFYRYFLLRLFHDGLGKAQIERNTELDKVLGKVPYLNGGFFEVHQLEEKYTDIDIADKAFEKLFDFFDLYDWHLDERPLRKQNEINPDVVGYIFEKYINQKQMGAYYTKEDITEYISKSTIIPFLFNAAEKKCPIAFKADSFLWRLLRDDPDRYIYAAVKKGVIDETGAVVPLPKEIAAGIQDVSKRDGWNKPAPAPYALPTETWREHVARRTRCLELREKLKSGQVQNINDLITFNLDLWQFARDVIINCEGPELLRAFWHAIQKVTVLDPTCGSGAFLFAALLILESLYSDCLERMDSFVDSLTEKDHREKFNDFKGVLDQIAKHPNERYFILKSIIINNLFGVDIMEEAVEICKLRLFLKLVAQVETADQIEPLPDVDFNIRAGNTLVGYATLDEVRKSMEGKLGFGEKQVERIQEDAIAVEVVFKLFREQQTKHGGKVTARDKQILREKLEKLDGELDRYLAGEYGIDALAFAKAFDDWRRTHQPFHWFVEFYGIMGGGGFDVIIGNPPYIVYSEEKVGYRLLNEQYKTLTTKNLYAVVFERCLSLAQRLSPVGLIVQLTAISSERLGVFQDLLQKRGGLVVVPFPRRPESIFEGVEMPVVILLSLPNERKQFITTRVNRFYTGEREAAIQVLNPNRHDIRVHGHRIGKFSSDLEHDIFKRVTSPRETIDSICVDQGDGVLFYQEACRYWLKAFDALPYFARNGKRMEPPHGRVIALKSRNAASFVACLLNSSLFYWFYSAFSDCEHVNDVLLRTFKMPDKVLSGDWRAVSERLMKRLGQTATRKTIKTKQGHTIQYDEMKAANAKNILDEIDTLLAKWYNFTAAEYDFLINYDIKYRQGDVDGDEG